MTSASTSSEIADRVLWNDPELQHLYLSSDSFDSQSQVDKLAQALASNTNTCLQHVYFRNFKLGVALPPLLHALQHLDNLQSVFFHCTEVPVTLLTQVFRPSRWTALGLRYCRLKYETHEDLELLEESLRSNTTLQDVCVECCEWQPEEPAERAVVDNSNAVRMSSFLQAIARIPSLQHVECVLNATPTHQRLPPETLRCLGQIPLLETLRLRHVWMPQDDVSLLCHALSSSTTLQKLILSCDMGPTSALALGQLLQSLPLQHLALRMDQLEHPDSPELLALALANCALQHFHLSGRAAGQLSSRAKTAFRDTMQCNSSLEFVRLEVNDYALQSEIAFYLQLNHKGRRALLQTLKTKPEESSAVWVQALCQNATDVRALHYFLALNPGFFASIALQQGNAKDTTSDNNWDEGDDDDDGIMYDSDGW